MFVTALIARRLKVVGIDVLNSFEQELAISTEDGNTVIHSLLVKDYPVILRLSPQSGPTPEAIILICSPKTRPSIM